MSAPTLAPAAITTALEFTWTDSSGGQDLTVTGFDMYWVTVGPECFTLRFQICPMPPSYVTVNGDLFDGHGVVICPFCFEACGSRLVWGCDRNRTVEQAEALDRQVAFLNGQRTPEQIVRECPVNRAVVTA